VSVRLPRRSAVFAGGLVAAMTLVGCGSSSGGGSVAAPSAGGSAVAVTADSALAARLPAKVKSAGVINSGTDASYAPIESIAEDGKTIEGFDVDLGNAMGAKLGVKINFVNSPFDSIIPGIDSGKYDVGFSSFTPTAQRMQKVDFVNYLNNGTLWAVKKGNPGKINADDACGKKVAVQKGTTQVDDITARSKKCTDAGKPAITVDQYQLQTDATTAVVSGKDDAMLADSPVVSYAVVKSGGQVEQLGDQYGAAPTGIALPKGSPLTQLFADTLTALIKDGTYGKITSKWGLDKLAVTSVDINKV
jgi:polar amino acid transport system substrate-binding protein